MPSQKKAAIHNVKRKAKPPDSENSSTYLAFDGTGFIVTLGGGTTHTNSTIPGLNTSSLGQVLFSLLLPNLNLLFFTTTTEFFGPELVPGLELSATMLWDVTLRHGCLEGCENKEHHGVEKRKGEKIGASIGETRVEERSVNPASRQKTGKER